MSHRSRLAGFIIDCHNGDLGASSAFWGAALGMRVADAGVTSMVATAGGSDEPLHAAMNRPMRSQQRASHAPVAEAVDRTRSSPLM